MLSITVLAGTHCRVTSQAAEARSTQWLSLSDLSVNLNLCDCDPAAESKLRSSSSQQVVPGPVTASGGREFTSRRKFTATTRNPGILVSDPTADARRRDCRRVAAMGLEQRGAELLRHDTFGTEPAARAAEPDVGSLQLYEIITGFSLINHEFFKTVMNC